MARRHKTQKVVDAVGAMVEADIPIEDMRGRLANDECGLGYKKTISRRTLYGYRGDYLDDKRHQAARQDSAVETVGSVKQQAIDLLHRELVTLERKTRQRGISKEEVTVVRRIHTALDEMERREAIALKRRGNRPKQPNQSRGKGKAEQPAETETALEKAAREFSEQPASSPPITDPPQGTSDQTPASRELDTASSNAEPTANDLGLPLAPEQQEADVEPSKTTGSDPPRPTQLHQQTVGGEPVDVGSNGESPATAGVEPDAKPGSRSRPTLKPAHLAPASPAQARARIALLN